MYRTPPVLLCLVTLAVYFVLAVGIGWWARQRSQTAAEYLNASRSLPLWIVTAAYLAANCGALDIVGMSAMAAQYGVPAFHFYWIGAVPALVFLALWMMPVYRRSGVRSVPEYLLLRFGPRLRLLNSCLLALTILLLGGVGLYAIGQVLQVMSGLSFTASILIAAVVVLLYVLLGGVKATIYNEIFQLLLVVGGLVPLAWLCRHNSAALQPHTLTGPHLWKGMPLAARGAPLDALGVVFGLGFVLSFGYWCTDFVQMQRAFSARTEQDARRVPLLAGFGKLGFSLLVILPGLAAARQLPALGSSIARFDQTIPRLMQVHYGPAMLALGMTALVASLMSGLAANVSGFAALWTSDIYRGHLAPERSDAHYLWMAHVASIVAIGTSIGTSYIDFLFGNLMEHIQLIFSVFGAPFWAIFLLGMGTRRTTERGAIAGLLAGTSVALLHLAAVARGVLHYGSVMTANFYLAIYSFSTALLVAWLSSLLSVPCVDASPAKLRFHLLPSGSPGANRLLWILSACLLLACLWLNLLWR